MKNFGVKNRALLRQQKRIQASKELLEQFFDINLDLLCIADVDGNFIKVNKAWTSILGYPASYLEGKRFLELVHPDDMQPTMEAIAQLKQQNPVMNFINRYRCKDGSYRFIEWRSHPEGNLIYAAAHDITNRLRDEEQLQRQKEQFELAIKGSNDGIWDWDLINSAFFLSAKWKEQLGYQDNEVKNEWAAFENAIHPDDKEMTLEKLHQYVSGASNLFDMEFRMLHKSGTYRWVRMRGEALRDASGKAYRMTGSQTDITDRKETEAALRNSEEQYRMITENISDVISVYNISRHCYTFYSPSVTTLRGYTAEEAMAQSHADNVKPDDLKITTEKITHLVEKFRQDPAMPTEAVFEIQTRHKNGHLIWVETATKVQRNKQGEIELLNVSRNINKRKTAELEVEYLSYHDNLTGLFNRHFFDKRVTEEMARADRYGKSLSMIMFDLDHFKKVNDQWGHPVGDAVLKRIAEITEPAIRSIDVLARIGGEEFVILMPETTKDGAYLVAERIRNTIQSSIYPITGTVTVSLGVAELLQHESFISFYKRCDDALYEAKRSGRNCSHMADSRITIVPTVDFEWISDWDSGDTDIDNQHKDLLTITNTLIRMTLSSSGLVKTIELLETAMESINGHFQYEEKILHSIGYPDYEKHCDIHKRLLEKMANMKASFTNREILSSDMQSFLLDDVIVGHMLKDDILFFPYTRKANNLPGGDWHLV